MEGNYNIADKKPAMIPLFAHEVEIMRMKKKNRMLFVISLVLFVLIVTQQVVHIVSSVQEETAIIHEIQEDDTLIDDDGG